MASTHTRTLSGPAASTARETRGSQGRHGPRGGTAAHEAAPTDAETEPEQAPQRSETANTSSSVAGRLLSEVEGLPDVDLASEEARRLSHA